MGHKSLFRQFCTVSFLLFFLTACIRTQLTRLSDSSYSAIDPEEVRVYLTEDDVKGEYDKIGLIHAQGTASWTNEQQMIEAARKKAASIGANGIILGNINEPSSGAKVAAKIFGTYTTRRGEVVAIYVKSFEVPPESNVADIQEFVGFEPETKLPFFRASVPVAEKYSDEEILAAYRKKYPKLKSKSDEELIDLIERKYNKIVVKKKT